MPALIQDYLIGLGYKLDTIGAKRFSESLITTAANFTVLGKNALEAAFMVEAAVEDIASNYENLYYLSQRTGATVQALQATAFGFGQVGLKAEDAKGMVDALALSLKFNPGTTAILQALGVHPTSDANADMMQALYRLRGLPGPLQKGFGSELGMSPAQLMMLLSPGALERIEATGTDLSARQREAGIDPQQIAKDSVALENSLRKLESEFGVLEERALSPLIVNMTALSDGLESFLEWFGGLGFKKGSTIYDRSNVKIDAAGAEVGHMLGRILGGEDSPAGRQPTTTGWWTPEREQHAIDRLVAGGVSPLGAAALVSRWKNVESAGGPSSANNIAGGHFGIAQWDQARAGNIWGDSDPDRQYSHVLEELYSTERASFDALNSAKTPWEAARGASMYERAGGYNRALGTDDYTGRTAAGITMGSVTFTTNVHGGADPKVTADYVLQGQKSQWDDMIRYSGASVR